MNCIRLCRDSKIIVIMDQQETLCWLQISKDGYMMNWKKNEEIEKKLLHELKPDQTILTVDGNSRNQNHIYK